MQLAGGLRTFWIAALVSGALLSSSCGSSPTATAPGSPAPAEKTGPEIDLLAHDGSFEPLALRFEPGDRVELVVVNDGFAPHTFTIRRLGLDELIPAHSTRRVTFVMPDRAAPFTCRFHAVMRGRLVPSL
jgi:hypothetical protein